MRIVVKIICGALLALCVCVTCSFDGCTVAPQSGTYAGGFPVVTQTDLLDSDGNLITTEPAPGIAVTGVWLSDGTGAAGSVENFSKTTDENGNAFVRAQIYFAHQTC